MPILNVNLDTVASVRELQRWSEPEPAQAAVLAELAGAGGISVQFHRGRKTIRERDLYLLKGIVKSKLIVELAPTEENIEKVLEIKPWLVFFAADHADPNSPFSPIDFLTLPSGFNDIIDRFSAVGVNTGFLVEPDEAQIKTASKTGASALLIDCTSFTMARTIAEAQTELDKIDSAAKFGSKFEMSIFAGRGLTYRNIHPLVELGLIDEFIIGFAICARAQLVGFDSAVKEMLALINSPVLK